VCSIDRVSSKFAEFLRNRLYLVFLPALAAIVAGRDSIQIPVDYSELTLIRFVRSSNNRNSGPEFDSLLEVSRVYAKTF